MRLTNATRAALALGIFASLVTEPCGAKDTASVDPAEVETIAEEAMIYAFPMVMAYGIMYEFSIDKASDQYRGPFNQIDNIARVFTPKDTAVVTPNSDTPYSFVGMDLR